MESINEKVIVITGASSGIGAATAQKLGSMGAKLVLGARREIELKAIASQFENNVCWKSTDVTKREEVDALIALAVSNFGRVDILFNNAGVMPISFFEEGKVDDWDAMVDVNIKGVLYGINAVLPHMLRQQSGHILATSSIAGIRTNPGLGVYCGTKFAVRAIMDTLRQEIAEYIKVTTIYPGATKSELSGHIASDKIKQLYQSAQKTPVMEAEAIADAVIYAIGQPGNVSVNDIVIRPLGQVR